MVILKKLARRPFKSLGEEYQQLYLAASKMKTESLEKQSKTLKVKESNIMVNGSKSAEQDQSEPDVKETKKTSDNLNGSSDSISNESKFKVKQPIINSSKSANTNNGIKENSNDPDDVNMCEQEIENTSRKSIETTSQAKSIKSSENEEASEKSAEAKINNPVVLLD
jgi:hypothetical protein